MRRLLLLLSVVSLLAAPGFATDLHVVSFSNGVPSGFATRVAELGGTVEFTHDGASVGAVRGLTAEAAGVLARLQGVQQVEADVEFQAVPTPQEAAAFGLDTIASPANPATAFFYPRQWHMRTIGADKAWAAGYLGKPEVTVAVLDTGVAYSHADLAGLVDLSRSVSFQNAPGSADEFYLNLFYPGAHPVADLQYHGTHVAATIASNALVAAGVTSKVTIMGVKVLDVFGNGNTSITSRGILHAVDNGADVINMSLGGGFPKNAVTGLGAYLNRVLNYANRKGVVVVVAAGNDFADLDHNGNVYSTYCDSPNTICVSATGPKNYSLTGPWLETDSPASYTNYGRSAVSVAGPGGDVSFVYAACSNFTVYNLPCWQSPTYVLGMNGTSMASPHVAGLAALLVGEIGKGKPAQVRARILQSATDLGQPGTDPYYGKGLINVAKALGVE